MSLFCFANKTKTTFQKKKERDFENKKKNKKKKEKTKTTKGRKLLNLIKATSDVTKYHQIDTSLQVKEFISETRDYLHKMIRIISVRDELLGTISVISDFSYGWEVITDFIKLMQKFIKNDPNIVLLLRATFLKMASVLEQPLQRIQQCNSEDLMSVSSFYSEKLVDFVRKVLDIIPKTMFDMLEHIAKLRYYFFFYFCMCVCISLCMCVCVCVCIFWCVGFVLVI